MSFLHYPDAHGRILLPPVGISRRIRCRRRLCAYGVAYEAFRSSSLCVCWRRAMRGGTRRRPLLRRGSTDTVPDFRDRPARSRPRRSLSLPTSHQLGWSRRPQRRVLSTTPVAAISKGRRDAGPCQFERRRPASPRPTRENRGRRPRRTGKAPPFLLRSELVSPEGCWRVPLSARSRDRGNPECFKDRALQDSRPRVAGRAELME